MKKRKTYFEKVRITLINNSNAFNWAMVGKRRNAILPEKLLKVLKSDAQCAYLYAFKILNKRWEEGEKAIVKDPGYAIDYAKNVLKSPFLEAEKNIAKDREYAFIYSREVLKKRFLRAEKLISSELDMTSTLYYSDWKHEIDKDYKNGNTTWEYFLEMLAHSKKRTYRKFYEDNSSRKADYVNTKYIKKKDRKPKEK